ncbi:hypothetical protein LshimejAT787_0100140 [Lyophyllum shimeji]|uniref:Uncharacterized protein n=1 Tax=Lyophyllum shimeji TaxID=47721 RepID=A0A9P3UH37_LYOSH|nr:hypothetical protein LshimejAT787_0100140 [Lyophyllum shimeji]
MAAISDPNWAWEGAQGIVINSHPYPPRVHIVFYTECSSCVWLRRSRLFPALVAGFHYHPLLFELVMHDLRSPRAFEARR